MIGYKSCENIPLGKQFEGDKELKNLVIPTIYYCKRNSPSSYVCKTFDPSTLSHSQHSNLSMYPHEDIISDDIFDSLLNDVLYQYHQNEDANLKTYPNHNPNKRNNLISIKKYSKPLPKITRKKQRLNKNKSSTRKNRKKI